MGIIFFNIRIQFIPFSNGKGKTNFEKFQFYNAMFESSQGTDVTFSGEELFNTNKEVILLKQFYTIMFL